MPDLKIPVVDLDALDVVMEQNKQIKFERKEAAEQITLEAKRNKRDPNEELAKMPPAPATQPVPVTTPLTLTVEVAVKDKDGKVLKTQTQDVLLKRYKAAWQKGDVGVTDKVIPPWTPVTFAQDTVGVWNRKMKLDGLGQLKKIDNGGVDQILSMRLVAVKDGKEVEIQASSLSVVKQVENQLNLQGQGHGAGLALTARTQAEFDGFVLINMTIAPEAADANVDKLYLEVVMPESEATHYCTTAGGWSAVHDVTPPHWTSQTTASGMLIGDFVPYIWLTNSDRAFLWFADSDKGWITDPDKKLPTQEIIRQDGKVTLRVHFIEIPSQIKTPHTIQYGYQTFPSRPLPQGWRSMICGPSAANFPSARNTYTWFAGDWAVLWPYYCSPFPFNYVKSKEEFSRFPAETNHRPMVGSIAHSIGRYSDYAGAQFPEYVVDWAPTPGVQSSGNVTSCAGANNFRLFSYQRWVRDSGFRGLYVDENYLNLEENSLTGNAYYRPEDGKFQRAYSYLGLRDYFKRMKVMFHQNNVPTPNLWQHITSGAAYNAWFGDIFFEGENVEPTDLNFDYIEVLPAGRMRAIGSAVCAGGAMTMMCQSQRHATIYEPKHTHQFVGWVMAHDILPEQVHFFNMMAQEARLYEANVEFLPYWKTGPLSTKTPDCIVSAHKAGKRTLVWVVNVARKDQQVSVAVDFAKLGLDPAKTIAIDAETGKAVELTAAGFTVPVLQRDFVAVHLIEPQGLKPGQTFYASFDKSPAAEEARGNAVVTIKGAKGAQQATIVEGVKGKAIATGGGAEFWPHLNLNDQQGRMTFQIKIAADTKGAILSAGPVSIVLDKGKGVGQMLLQVETPAAADANAPAGDAKAKPAKPKAEGKNKPAARKGPAGEAKTNAAPLPAEGWHEFELTWRDGKVSLKMDGKAVGELEFAGFGIGSGTGTSLMKAPRFIFGGEALDELTCYGKAE